MVKFVVHVQATSLESIRNRLPKGWLAQSLLGVIFVSHEKSNQENMDGGDIQTVDYPSQFFFLVQNFNKTRGFIQAPRIGK